jgi:hypothetical protein
MRLFPFFIQRRLGGLGGLVEDRRNIRLRIG